MARPGLRRSSDAEPGIRRRRAGRGFTYLAADGSRVREATTLARIRALSMPPAYTDVWICADPRGHLQATGRDARGRKQYRYHVAWRHRREAKKYRRLLRFARRLPALRAQLRRDMRRDGLPREKVLAVMVGVMMETALRIGSDAYTRSNRSYGLTTLLARHATFARDGSALFRFTGKGGLAREVVLRRRPLVRVVRRCSRLPGRALFQYEVDGVPHRAGAAQLNEYLHAAMGERFSAKDFRTWAGTLTVIAELACTPLPRRGGQRAQRAAVRAAIVAAAAQLGNTPAVCRKAYVCPQVEDGWRAGDLHRCVPVTVASRPRRLERHATRFLQHCIAARD